MKSIPSPMVSKGTPQLLAHVVTPSPHSSLPPPCRRTFRFTPLPGDRRKRATRARPTRRASRPDTHVAIRRNPVGLEACPSPTKRNARNTSKKE
eukprot:1040062-Pyramimonas_sp.AAC.1